MQGIRPDLGRNWANQLMNMSGEIETGQWFIGLPTTGVYSESDGRLQFFRSH
jgi:hypothetical protein